MMMPSSTAEDDDAKLHMSTNPPTPPLSETRGPLHEPSYSTCRMNGAAERWTLLQRQASVSAGNLDGKNSHSLITIVGHAKIVVAVMNSRVSGITCSGIEFYIPIANRYPTSANKFPVGRIVGTIDNGQTVKGHA